MPVWGVAGPRGEYHFPNPNSAVLQQQLLGGRYGFHSTPQSTRLAKKDPTSSPYLQRPWAPRIPTLKKRRVVVARTVLRVRDKGKRER